MITEAFIDSYLDLYCISQQAIYKIFKLVDIQIFTKYKYNNYLLNIVLDPNKNFKTNSSYKPDLGSKTSIKKHYINRDP
jgi:hypothetical protein